MPRLDLNSTRSERRFMWVDLVAMPGRPLTASRESSGVLEALYRVAVLTYLRYIAYRGEVMGIYIDIKECRGASSCGYPFSNRCVL